MADPPGPRSRSGPATQVVDPVGTAASTTGYLLVEWPLPWPRDLSEIPELAPVLDAAKAAGLRVQALVPRDGGDDARVIRYSPPGTTDEAVGHLERAEVAVPADKVIGAAADLADGARRQPGPGSAEPVTDVLICTHGRRDACCGSRAPPWRSTLAHLAGPVGDGRVRLWRTSHTGGHRFAPTAIVLPGATWCRPFLDPRARRSRRPGRAPRRPARPLPRLPRPGVPGDAGRRAGGLGRRRMGLVRLDARRGAPRDGRVRVTGRSPTGAVAQLEASVEVRRQLPVPDCGRPSTTRPNPRPEPQLDLVVADDVGARVSRRGSDRRLTQASSAPAPRTWRCSDAGPSAGAGAGPVPSRPALPAPPSSPGSARRPPPARPCTGPAGVAAPSGARSSTRPTSCAPPSRSPTPSAT